MGFSPWSLALFHIVADFVEFPFVADFFPSFLAVKATFTDIVTASEFGHMQFGFHTF